MLIGNRKFLHLDDKKNMLMFFLLSTLDIIDAKDQVPAKREDVIDFIYSLQIFNEDGTDKGTTIISHHIRPSLIGIREGIVCGLQGELPHGVLSEE